MAIRRRTARIGIFGPLVVAVLVSMALIACDREQASREERPRSDESQNARWTSTFDGKGIVEWLSPADGRYLVMRAFDRDTDENGRIEVRIGQHGEPEGDEPRLVLVDTRTSDTQILEALFATGGHPWLAFRRKARDRPEVVLLDTGSGMSEVLDGVTTVDDANPCLGPRGVSLSPDGRAIASIESDERSIRIGATRKLETLERVEVPGRVWRIESLTEDWSLVHLVENEFPRAKTTCVCSWCRGIATSLGSYGFEGEWESVLVSRSGQILEFSGSMPKPISKDVMFDQESREGGLRRIEAKGKSVLENAPPVPGVDTRFVVGVMGAGQFVTVEDSGQRWLADGLGGRQPLPSEVRINDYGIRRHLDRAWNSHLLVRRVAEEHSLVSLDLESGRVRPSTTSHRAGPVHPMGWVLVASREGLAAFHLETGVVQAVDTEMTPGTLDALAFENAGKWFIVEPLSGKSREVDSRPRFVTEDGCALITEGRPSRIEDGPWRLVCVSGS